MMAEMSHKTPMVKINFANEKELRTLSGVGEKVAKNIIEARVFGGNITKVTLGDIKHVNAEKIMEFVDFEPNPTYNLEGGDDAMVPKHPHHDSELEPEILEPQPDSDTTKMLADVVDLVDEKNQGVEASMEEEAAGTISSARLKGMTDIGQGHGHFSRFTVAGMPGPTPVSTNTPTSTLGPPPMPVSVGNTPTDTPQTPATWYQVMPQGQGPYNPTSMYPPSPYGTYGVYGGMSGQATMSGQVPHPYMLPPYTGYGYMPAVPPMLPYGNMYGQYGYVPFGGYPVPTPPPGYPVMSPQQQFPPGLPQGPQGYQSYQGQPEIDVQPLVPQGQVQGRQQVYHPQGKPQGSVRN